MHKEGVKISFCPWHKLQLFGEKSHQLRRYPNQTGLWASLWIFFSWLMVDVGGSSWLRTFSSPGGYKKAGWGSNREWSSKQHSYVTSASVPPCRFLACLSSLPCLSSSLDERLLCEPVSWDKPSHYQVTFCGNVLSSATEIQLRQEDQYCQEVELSQNHHGRKLGSQHYLLLGVKHCWNLPLGGGLLPSQSKLRKLYFIPHPKGFLKIVLHNLTIFLTFSPFHVIDTFDDWVWTEFFLLSEGWRYKFPR